MSLNYLTEQAIGQAVLPEEIENVFNSLTYLNTLKGDETVFLHTKGISQSKIRDKGFNICRQTDKADVIIIYKPVIESRYYYTGGKPTNYFSTEEPLDYFNKIIDYHNLGYKFILEPDFYKYLNNTKCDLELFNTLNSLFKTTDSSNIKLAMEIMTTTDWTGNRIYLQELFAKYYHDKMKYNSYATSVSFKGFLDTLDFRYKYIYFNTPDAYREICESLEHHQWVFDKHKEEFEQDLKELTERFKIKIDDIKYSIDYTPRKEENED